MMRVCHVLRCFAPQQWGGIESAVYHLVKEQQASGLDVEIEATAAFSKPGEDFFHGIPVHRFSSFFPWWRLSTEAKQAMEKKGGNPFSFGLLRYLLTTPHVDLLHTHVQLRLGGIVRAVARLRKIPYVVTVHGGFFTIPLEQTERMREGFKKGWEWGKALGWMVGSRKVLREADAVICLSREEYQEMQRRLPHRPIFHIPNGVEVSRFSVGVGRSFREAYGIPEKERLILCVSRIDYQKNQLLLLKSFARFQKEFPDYRLVFLGPVSVQAYQEELEGWAKKLQIQHKVSFIPGYSPENAQLVNAYHAADIFVLPSSTEPFGIVILEAWAARVPVIASATGGIQDLIREGVNGLLFENGNEDPLYRQLKRLASSPELRQQLKEQGALDVKKYDWKAIHQEVLNVYNQVRRK